MPGMGPGSSPAQGHVELETGSVWFFKQIFNVFIIKATISQYEPYVSSFIAQIFIENVMYLTVLNIEEKEEQDAVSAFKSCTKD